MKRILAVVAAVLLLAGCAPAPTPDKPIDSLVYHQYQAIEDFDDSEYTQHEPSQVARFMELLEEYDVVPGVTVTTVEDNCAGGLSTTVTVNYTDNTSADMFIAACGEPDYDEFNSAATALFSEWRSEAAG